jgi:nitrite reductase/ring-hydroxylating ferredoxin subunit/uncharacterized membrane protein
LRRPALHELAERIGRLRFLDPIGGWLGATVRGVIPAGPVKDALSGTRLGHALHPLLTDVPIGAWTSATVLDLVGGDDAAGAAETLIAVGLMAAGPTFASGWSDWSDSELESASVRRLGLVHAWSNGSAAILYAASLVARRSGERRIGIVLGLAGAGALSAGGFLGGHLTYAKGVGVDVTAFESRPRDWVDAGAADLDAGEIRRISTEGADVVVCRHDGYLHALANRCTHRGGPLHEGNLVGGCIECPLHGSRFSFVDGSVERGPATAPQPVYEVREIDGRVEVRARS